MERRQFIKLAAPALILPVLPRLDRAHAAFAIFQTSGNPWQAVDGSLNAPTGTPQYPAALNGYPIASPPGARIKYPNIGTQPPWGVAGIDYRVGINTGVALILPTAHAQLTVAGKNATINTASAVIDGVDFTDYSITVQTANCTVRNCRFGVTSGNPSGLTDIWIGLSGGTNLTVEYCDFDFTNFTSVSRPGMVNSISSTFTARYNRFYNAFSDAISVAGGVSTIQYNLFAQDQAFAVGAHADFWQMNGSGATLIAQFNTGVCSIPGSGANGYQAFYLANGTGWVGTSDCGWNTFTGSGTPNGDVTGGSYLGMFGDSGLSPYTVHDNYIDPLWCRNGTVYHDLTGITATGNINMNTGASENS